MRKAAVKVKDAAITNGKQNIIIVAALVVLALIFYALNPNFLNRFNVVSMTQSLAPYAILALGVTFVIATGGIDLSIGTVCIASAVISGFCYTKGMPLWLTIPMMIVIGGLFGLLNGFLVAKLKLPAFIATLGTMMLSRGLSALIVSVPNIFFPGGTWFNSTFSNLNGFPIGLVWVIGLMLLCMYLMYKNKVGRYILSIGSNEEATRLSGINTDKYKMLAYVFCGIGAGVAAIFWSASFTTGKYKIEKEVKPGDADQAYKTALEALYEKGIKALFMSNEGVVKQVSDAIAAAGTKYDAIKFCGFDAGTKQIEWMKKTTGAKLIGAVAQDSYQIGYNAVEQAVFAAEGKTVTASVAIAGSWWDATNVDQMIKNNIVYEG